MSMRKRRRGKRRGGASAWIEPIPGLRLSPEGLSLWRAQSRAARDFARAALRPSPSLPRLSELWRRGGGGASACALGLPASVFLASARGGSRELWAWLAARDQGVEDRLRNGWGFEHLAAFHKNEAALAWWASRGGGADRRTAGGNTVWSLGWEGGGEILASLERLWPTGSEAAAANGLREMARFLSDEPGQDAEPNYLRRFYFAGSLPAMLEALRERPLAVGPGPHLSDLLDSVGWGGGEELDWVKGLEAAARASAERDEIARGFGWAPASAPSRL